MAQADYVPIQLCAQITRASVKPSRNHSRLIPAGRFVRPAGPPLWMKALAYSEASCGVEPVDTTVESTS